MVGCCRGCGGRGFPQRLKPRALSEGNGGTEVPPLQSGSGGHAKTNVEGRIEVPLVQNAGATSYLPKSTVGAVALAGLPLKYSSRYLKPAMLAQMLLGKD